MAHFGIDRVYLSAGEAEILFRAVPRNGTLKPLRDRAMIALMAIEGLRRVEIMRGSVQDIETIPDGERQILVHGKGKKGYIYPREDTLSILDEYLATRGRLFPDRHGEPLYVSIGKGGNPGGRISRIGVNHIVNGTSQSLGSSGRGSHAMPCGIPAATFSTRQPGIRRLSRRPYAIATSLPPGSILTRKNAARSDTPGRSL